MSPRSQHPEDDWAGGGRPPRPESRRPERPGPGRPGDAAPETRAFDGGRRPHLDDFAGEPERPRRDAWSAARRGDSDGYRGAGPDDFAGAPTRDRPVTSSGGPGYEPGPGAGGPPTDSGGFSVATVAGPGRPRGQTFGIAAAVLVVLAVLGGVGWYFLGHKSSTSSAAPGLAGGNGTSAAAPAWSTPAAVPSSSMAASPSSQSAQSSRSAEPSTVSPAEPARARGNSRSQDGTGGQKPSGADESGWLSPSGARCNNGDRADVIAETARSRVSICTNPDNGRKYYRGTYDSDSMEADDPTVYNGAFTLSNNGVIYHMDRSYFTITEGGTELSKLPLTSWWQD